MKRCPKCQSTYTDDLLSYCLQDGSTLAAINDPASSADVMWEKNEGREQPPTEIFMPEGSPTVGV
ncbi:MAG: hypothetical protein LC731_05485, partial [Acidobacteria bacterium]|nr:hypothetical protein [Acidobacteriota bacterium]